MGGVNNSVLRVYHVEDVPFSRFLDFCQTHCVTALKVDVPHGTYRVTWCGEQVVDKSVEKKLAQADLFSVT